MIRGRLPDEIATYPDAMRGVNLRKSLEDLEPGESELMQNCYWDSDIRKRFGAARWTTVSFGMVNALGGHKGYFGDGTGIRLVAFGTNIMRVNDSGTFATLTSTMTTGNNTYFADWAISDRIYVGNGADSLRYIDSTGSISTLTGTNVPASPTMIVPFADRLFAIQGTVVIASDPRVDTIWASTGSAWSAYRGIGGSGNPTAIALHSSTGYPTDPQSQLLIFQRNTVTALIGTNFGSPVTAGSPPTDWDAQLVMLDPRVGTSSPYSVCNVPGVGTFWFTSERNVAWLPIGASIPRLIGNSLFSYRAGIQGINDVTQSQLSQVLMIYHDLKLKLYLPVNGQAYSTVQYWLDLRPLMENLASMLTQPVDQTPANWSGPHLGQSIRRVWIENQSSDQERLMGLEGNPTNGLVVYELNPTGYFKDDVGPILANMAAWYRQGIGITSASSLVSQWADQSGNGRHLNQTTATNRPTVQADGSILFDGVDNFMAATFTLNQPHTIYVLGKQLTWTAGDHIFNGVAANVALYQNSSSPRVDIYAGAGGPFSTAWTLDTDMVVAAVFNGASSLIQVNTSVSTEGDPGADNPGGFTLGGNNSGAANSNIQVKEVILYSAAHDASTRARVIAYLQQDDNVRASMVSLESNNIPFHYKSFFHPFGAPGYQKYLYDLLIDTQGYINFATVTVNDLHATLTSGYDIRTLAGAAFTNVTYSTPTGYRYGNGTRYGQASANNLGHVQYSARSSVIAAGDALQIEVEETAGNHFAINSIRPQVKIQKIQPYT